MFCEKLKKGLKQSITFTFFHNFLKNSLLMYNLKTLKIIEYFGSIINAYFLLSHELWVLP